MRDIGLPGHPWQASVKGNPNVVIASTSDANANLKKAPADGQYVGDDGIPHKVRKGDPIPEGSAFKGGGPVVEEGGEPADAQGAGVAEETATKKSGKRGPSETTDAAGPKETT